LPKFKIPNSKIVQIKIKSNLSESAKMCISTISKINKIKSINGSNKDKPLSKSLLIMTLPNPEKPLSNSFPCLIKKLKLLNKKLHLIPKKDPLLGCMPY